MKFAATYAVLSNIQFIFDNIAQVVYRLQYFRTTFYVVINDLMVHNLKLDFL